MLNLQLSTTCSHHETEQSAALMVVNFPFGLAPFPSQGLGRGAGGTAEFGTMKSVVRIHSPRFCYQSSPAASHQPLFPLLDPANVCSIYFEPQAPWPHTNLLVGVNCWACGGIDMERVRYLNQFLRMERADGKADATLKNHCKCLQGFDKWLTSSNGLNDAGVVALDLADYIGALRQKHPADQINNSVSALRVYFRWLKETEIIEVNPALRLKFLATEEKPVQALTEEEVKLLLNYVARAKGKRFGMYRSAILTNFLIETGVRLGEALSLRVKDLDFIECRISVHASKTRSNRYVFITAILRQKLIQYLRRRQEHLRTHNLMEEGYLFCAEHGGHWDTSSAERSVACAARLAGITRRVYPHLMRHTFATLTLMNGAPLPAVMKLGGWKKLATLKRYVCFTEQQLKQVQAQSSPLAHAARIEFVIPNQ